MAKTVKIGRPEAWTELKALALADGLIQWMKESDEHLFFKEFLLIKKGLGKNTVKYLETKFQRFSERIEIARTIQEHRLANLTLTSRNPAGAIFLLKNHHGYADKQEIKQETVTRHYDGADLARMTMEQLLTLQEELSQGEG